MKMTLISNLILLFLLSCAERNIDNLEPVAQGVTYIKLLGGNNPDIGRSIQKNGNGFIITGWTESKGAGFRDMWLVDIDQMGLIKWDKTFGDQNNDWGYYAQSTSDNGIILSGRTSTGNVPGGQTPVVPTIFVAKTDSNGNELWRSLLGPSIRSRIGYQVLETNDNGYIVLAYHNNANLGTVSEGSPYIAVYRLDANGNQLWVFTYKIWSTGYSITKTADGNYIIAGNIEEDHELDKPITDIKSNILLLKISDSGSLIWEKQFNYNDWDLAKSIKIAENGFVLTGYSGSYKTGDLDLLVLKLNDSGTEIWHQIVGGEYSDRGNDIIENSFGEYVVAGNTFSYDSGNGDTWLLKFSKTGDFLWNRVIGGSKLDFAYSLVETDDFGYMIVGETDSFNAVLTDILLIKTDRNGYVKRNGNGQFEAE